VYTRLYDYLSRNNLLIDQQFGFRENRCTMRAVNNLITPVYHELDKGNLVFALFLDFKKAFDCVNHSILLDKLCHYGLRGVPFRWFKSYLSGRTQYTVVNGHRSRACNVDCGVPQGSTLGPLLFLIFINDLVNSAPIFTFNLFADDSAVTYSFPRQSIHDIHLYINRELSGIHRWLCLNRIKLNVDKTKYLVFSYMGYHELNSICIDRSEIECVKYIKYLGLYLDNNLRFNEHISRVSTKVARSVGVLSKIRDLVPRSVLRMLYLTLVYPYFNYCINIWGGSAQIYINKLIILQKRAVRIVAGASFLCHADPLFKELNLLKLDDLFRLNVALYMYKSLNTIGYDSELSTYVYNNTGYHDYSTRNSLAVTLPLYKCEKTKCCIIYNVCKIWNGLPVIIQNSESVGRFKRSFILWLRTE